MKKGNTKHTLHRDVHPREEQDEPVNEEPRYRQHVRPDDVIGTSDKKPAAAFMAGYNSYLAWIPFLNNPYKDKRQRGLWINGYKRAERDTWLRDAWYMSRRRRERS